MVELKHGEFPILGSRLSPSMGAMEDFEESAQEQTVDFNIQPAAQPAQFTDCQLN